MPNASPEHLPEPVSVFGTRRLPAPARLAGYSALIEAYELEVPSTTCSRSEDSAHPA